jgi:hypothetical protein
MRKGATFEASDLGTTARGEGVLPAALRLTDDEFEMMAVGSGVRVRGTGAGAAGSGIESDAPTEGTTGGAPGTGTLGAGTLGAGALGAGVSPKMSPQESSSRVGGTTGAAEVVGSEGTWGAGCDLALDEFMTKGDLAAASRIALTDQRFKRDELQKLSDSVARRKLGVPLHPKLDGLCC